MTAYRYGDDIVVIDCGVMFPEEHQLGVDLVVPDVSYLVEHRDKVRGFLLTHGHEDHIGALPFILRQVQAPLYGTRLTLGLVRAKLEEHGLAASTKMVEIEPGDGVDLGEFDAQFIRVTHSIPEAVSIALRCPAGTVVQTGDFKFDPTPIDGMISDYALFTETGDEGVLALVSDSTNVERQGYSRSERIVGVELDAIFNEAKGRVIFTTFASNIHRLQQAITVGMKYDRKVALVGRSMIRNIRVARDLGVVDVPDNVFVPIEQVKNYHPVEITLLTTGSQGEPASALSRMAAGEHRHFDIHEGDTFVLSSQPIPGNEDAVHRNINNLFKRGATVIYGEHVHVSGHGHEEELRLMVNLTRPRFIVPVHGEARHLSLFKRMAMTMGYAADDVVVPDIGDVIRVSKEKIEVVDRVVGGSVLVDGIGIGDVGEAVLRDRKHLSQDGIFLPVFAIDRTQNEIIAGPDIVSRGFVFMEDAGELIEESRLLIQRVVAEELTEETDWLALRQTIRSRLSKFLFEKTGRRPMVMPVIQEV
ncbi:MAG: ribonuclease J [Armatimonadetes bacterium]|nr:ribonuclease J [Armatimonadota bacterium]